MKRYLFIICMAAVFGVSQASQDRQPKTFDNGDTVCFAGDSITHHGYYSKHIALYYITRFPESGMKFRNAGSEGDNAGGIFNRIDEDLRPDKSTVFTLMLGMNDCRASRVPNWKTDAADAKKHAQYLKIFNDNMAKVCDRLSAESKKLIIFSSSIYDGESDILNPITVGIDGKILPRKKDIPSPQRNAVLEVYASAARDIAKARNLEFVDMWTATNNLNKKLHKSDIHTSAIGEDRVHPSDFGGFLMAMSFLKQTGESPTVSDVRMDAKSGKILKSFYADISNVKITEDKISFDILEAAIPYPLTQKTRRAAAFVDFQNSRNRQILKLENLPTGNYELRIDGKPVAAFTRKLLESQKLDHFM